ncbi:MAG TPA: ABC transporter ATP-binding protein [Bacillales bacterium]|nr:ABC transporter ATP-binding protein [Bacillales bacterium]
MLSCNIHKMLRDFELKMDFSLENETLVIVGHSGCGKSTTLKLIAGLMAPEDGRIAVGERTFFDHNEQINVSPEERQTGFVFQNYALFPHLSVFENVSYGLDGQKMPKPEKAAKVERMLEALNISHLIESMPSDLSGGEQQRVALARSLVLDPEVLLLDEPLSALDVTTRGRVRRELKKTLSALNIPKIIVTHDYEDAISLGDRILVMDRGRVIQEGTAKELLNSPRSPFVADFSGTNFFPGEALEGNRLKVGEKGEILQSVTKAEHDRLSVMIYPWDIELAKDRPVNSKMNVLKGEAVNILSYGNRARIEMEGSLPLTAEIPAETLERLGLKEQETVYAMIDPVAVQVLKNTREVV